MGRGALVAMLVGGWVCLPWSAGAEPVRSAKPPPCPSEEQDVDSAAPPTEQTASSLTQTHDAPLREPCSEDPPAEQGGEPGVGGSSAAGTGGAGTSVQNLANQRRGLDAIGLPLVSFNSDLGFGFGAVGGGYYYSPGYTPYRHALAAQLFFTTRGVQNHWVRYDGPNLIGGARLEIRGEYRRELFFPFYGVGNNSAPGVVGNTTDRATSFDYFFPGGWVRIRGKPLKHRRQLEVFGGYAYHLTRINPYTGSALEAEQPVGIQGGSHGQVFFGALWDTRDNEPDPSRGGIQEVALRVAGGATGSAYDYVGLTLADRNFFTLGTPKLIFAQRFMADALWGQAPFFEWSQFGGTMGGEGIGGMSSVRGVPRNRYQGKVKVLSNSELRWYPYNFQLFGERTRVGGLLFFDIGRVWNENVDDGPWWLWHPGVGAGLRVVRRAAVARVDLGFSTETWRPGIYITFGHMF